MLVELRPKIDVLTTNVSESSTLVRNQLGRIDATLTDALDRTRLQVIRADELLNRTMDKVEETSEIVHKTVVSPLRQVNGLMAAISTGVEVFLGQKDGIRKTARASRRTRCLSRTLGCGVVAIPGRARIRRKRERPFCGVNGLPTIPLFDSSSPPRTRSLLTSGT
jgi:hypothetical protein